MHVSNRVPKIRSNVRLTVRENKGYVDSPDPEQSKYNIKHGIKRHCGNIIKFVIRDDDAYSDKGREGTRWSAQ